MRALLTVLTLASLGVTTTLALSCCTCDDLDVTGTSAEPQIYPCPFIIKVNKFAYKTNDPEEFLIGKWSRPKILVKQCTDMLNRSKNSIG